LRSLPVLQETEEFSQLIGIAIDCVLPLECRYGKVKFLGKTDWNVSFPTEIGLTHVLATKSVHYAI
jgi:hypothetical protein